MATLGRSPSGEPAPIIRRVRQLCSNLEQRDLRCIALGLPAETSLVVFCLVISVLGRKLQQLFNLSDGSRLCL